MPQFQEKDSLLLSKLFKSAPWMAKLHDIKDDTKSPSTTDTIKHPKPEVSAPAISSTITSNNDQGPIVDLLGIIDTTPSPPIYGEYTIYMYL